MVDFSLVEDPDDVKRPFKHWLRTVNNFRELQEIYEKLNQRKEKKKDDVEWVFRGHRCITWKLETTLDRAFRKLDPTDELDPRKRLMIEGGLLRRFARQSHHYLEHSPSHGNVMEWLSLMRHYGTPCRLLDWTYSFWAGVFFALEHAKKERSCSVWVANQKLLWSQLKRRHEVLSLYVDDEKRGSDPNVMKHETFRAVFMQGQLFVCPINAYGLNERLIIQQGTFLCPGDISKSFEDNLAALAPVIDPEPDFGDEVWELRIDATPEEKKRILKHLHRMNMNQATLYPGLDGFARSLETLMIISPEIFRPEPDWL